MRIPITSFVREGNRALHGCFSVFRIGTYNIQHVFWCDRNLKAGTDHWLWSVPPTLPRSLPGSTPRCSSIGWHWKGGQELSDRRGGLEWGNLFAPISAHCPGIPSNDLSLQGLCMQEVPPSVNYDWFAVLWDDCLYHPLPSVTFLRPLNRALLSIHLHRRRKILMIVAKLATFTVISCENQSRFTEVNGKPVSGWNNGNFKEFCLKGQIMQEVHNFPYKRQEIFIWLIKPVFPFFWKTKH